MKEFRLKRGIAAAVAGAVWFGAFASGVAWAQDDAYIRGYVAAVAEREFGLNSTGIEVNDGVVRLTGVPLSPAQRERFVEVLRRVEGVKDVEIVPVGRLAGATTQESKSGGTTVAGVDVGKAAKEAAAIAASPVVGPVKAVKGDEEGRRLGLLPGGSLFDPLIADPRWPHFAGTYRGYQDSGHSTGRDLDSVGGADFGGTLPVYRFSTPGGGATELGLQAGVFSIFNLDAESHDLVNADYFVALTDAYRIGDFSALFRVSHMSSHLGDEFILAHPGVQRVNLSYEKLDAVLSYDINRSWRVYGGPGWMFDTDPEDLDRWMVQYGIEWQSPWTFAGGRLRPIAAADFKHFDETGWDLNISVRAGVEIEGSELRGNRLMLLLEYFNGHSPAGQFFFDDTVQWWGLGLHWFF